MIKKINLKITPQIAELCGTIVGDGHLSRYISKKRTCFRIQIYGHKEDDYDYLKYIQETFHDIFNIKTRLISRHNCNELRIGGKSLLEFFENIGIPVGKKSHIVFIPNKIKNNPNLTYNFIKGLADTDFSISFKKGDRKNHSYPVIVGTSASKRLVNNVSEILKKLKIKHNIYNIISRNPNFGEFEQHRIEINGRENLSKWLKNIGFNNPKHLTKIMIWKRKGYCPPNLSLYERRELLKKWGG